MMATDPGRATRIVGVVLCVVAISAVPALPQSCYGELAAARSYFVGEPANGIAAGDFNSDGIPDLAVATGYALPSAGIRILLGNGDGSLRAGTAVTGIYYPAFVMAYDFNGDGALDLAVASSSGQGEASILLGDGAGAFTQLGSYAVGSGPVWIAGADVNGDGNVDLVTADSIDDTVTLLLGTGGGAFSVAGSLTAGIGPFAVAIADLDSDGRLDLLTGNGDGSVSFLKGDGAGGFGPPIVHSTGGTSAWGMAVGLLNGDPFTDVVVSLYPRSISVMLGTGGGGFQQPQSFVTDYQPNGVTIADVNADGKADVLASYGDGVLVLLGDGSGNLSTPTPLVAGGGVAQPVAVDLDRDGVGDIAVACSSKTVAVLKGRAGALPLAAVPYDVVKSPIGVVGVNVDGDWDRDLVAVGDYIPKLVIMTNDGTGAFQVGSPTGSGSYSGPVDLIAGDWNGDGRTDLAAPSGYEALVAIYLGAPGGVFLGPTTFSTDSGSKALAAADFNRDGRIDLVSVCFSDTASVLLGSGTGSFAAPINTFIGMNPVDVVATDLNGDGTADLAVPRSFGSDIAILIGNGNGTFQATTLIGLGSKAWPLSIASGHFNADGAPDLVVGGGDSPSMWVLIGDGNGTFQAPVVYATDAPPIAIVPADLDQNGTQDLALALADTSEVTLMSGVGNGAFTTLASYKVGYPVGMAVGDLNSDGAPDLAVANYYETVSVALTSGPQIVPGSLPSGIVGAPYSQTLTLSGGTPPVTFVLQGGSLPPGITLSSAGIISGTPTIAGSYTFTVKATDANACTALRSYLFTIDPKILYLAGQGLGPPNPNGVRLLGKTGGVAVDFVAYGAGQWGVNVGGGSIDGGAYDEILTGPGPGTVCGPQVRAFTRTGGGIGKVNFYAYGTLRYGVNVGSGLLDSDAYGEILSGAGPGAVFGPHVRGFNFDGASVSPIAKVSYFAYSTLKYGVNVAAGDLDADGYDEIGTGAGAGTVFGSHVRGFNYDGASVTAMPKVTFFAFSYAGYGASVALGDVEGDGFDEIAASPGPGPGHPCRFEGWNYDGTSIAALPGFDVTRSGSLYGGRVAEGDVSGDGNADLLTGLGRDPSAAAMLLSYTYDGSALTETGSAFAAFPGTYGVNVAWGTFD